MAIRYREPDAGAGVIDLDSVTAGGGERQALVLGNEVGTWGYAGGSSGTVNVPAGKKVLSIGAIATSPGATLAIDGGDAIPVPQNIGVEISPRGNLIAPTIVFSGTSSYSVEFV